MEFSRNYLVHYYEADCRKRLTLPSLVQYLEDIAILDSSSRGMDLAYYDRAQCGWMLLKWDISIKALPVFGETVRVATKVHAMKRFLADREFSVSAADGTLLASARSNWLLADTVRRRPIRIPEERYKTFGVSMESESDFIMIEDVNAVTVHSSGGDEGKQFRRTIRTVNTDIDTNQHVNNVRYVAWALDSLPASFSTDCIPSSIRVQYKKELAVGDEVLIVSHAGGLSTRHSIFKGTDEIAHMEIEWRRAD